MKIQEAFNTPDNFSFREVSEDKVLQKIGDISAGMLKSTIDIHPSILTKIINLSLRIGCFPDELKAAEVSPTFKKNDDLEKENYRPVSVLPHMSKVFERIMYTQIESFMEYKLSELLTGFRKNRSTQYCLINMLEKLKNILDKGGFVCDMFMDL